MLLEELMDPYPGYPYGVPPLPQNSVIPEVAPYAP
jgi:hypothetical protein